ncbi:hypothetical protein Acr_17g0004710 [Actinidia rufa]|uniref:RNase H type-1 domain-containing protein n=1 Tax=Actinidia rufa TaxID=165716 RepID=A0A7J0G2A5_9ERIC|nr:hypothetical protein Acr_17g0004710 [Actinidia rufa]
MAEQMRVMNENNACLIQLLACAANPPPLAAPPIHDIEQSHITLIAQEITPRTTILTEYRGGNVGRRVLPDVKEAHLHRNPIRDLDARLDAINNGAGALVIVDTLIRQTEPPFTERILRARVSSRFKLPNQLGNYEGKTDPMDHLDSYKSLMLLQGCSNENQAKERLPPLHRSPEGNRELERLRLRPGPLFDSLSKNVPKTLSALQIKADKYIAAEELAEAKRRRRGKDDHKRKEPDTRRADYREEARNKRSDRDPKRTNDKHPQPEVTPLEVETPKEYSSKRNLARWILFVDGSSNQQALADFVVESTHETALEPEVTPPEVETPKEYSSKRNLARWILFVDGSSNQHGCGARLVIQTLSGKQMEYAIRIGFKANNNEAEYEALLAGLRVGGHIRSRILGHLQ